MIKYNNGSDTVVVVLHEIYGLNKHIFDVCQKLNEQGLDVIAPNLLDEKRTFEYHQQELAYNYFFSETGIQKATQIVIEVLTDVRTIYKNIIVIGYSIGATIAWICSEEENLVDGLVGFYGSRIRDYTYLNPKCPSLLIFPNREKSFGVFDLIQVLAEKENVETFILEGEHGFLDPHSSQYNESSSRKASIMVSNFIYSNFKLSCKVR